MIRRGAATRLAVVAVLVAAAAVLSACAGFATSGPVNIGLAQGDVAPPDFSFVPLKPQDGASQEDIVRGFLDAGNGPDGNWAIAQLYLAPGFRSTWKPNAGVTIDDRAARSFSGSDGRWTATVFPTASVDQTGVYTPSDNGSTTLSFSLAKVDGQWRITDAPNGIVLGADQFGSVFHQYSLMYFDPTWNYLVPDERWFATSNATTRIAQALVDGKPAPWLAESVVSAFPENVSLALPSVPVTSGVAQVEMTRQVLALDSATIDRMQTQLLRSLQTAGITQVSITNSGTPVNAQPVTVTSTRIDPTALVQTEKGFGFLTPSTGALQSVPGVSDAMKRVQGAISSIELSADYATAAVRTEQGVVRVPSRGDVVTIDRRSGLVSPTIDPYGYIWSMPANDPKGLIAFSSQGKSLPFPTAWSGASGVTAIAMSRDGTRIAAIVTIGGSSSVVVAGVVRNADGVPQSIGGYVELAPLSGPGIDVTWLDDATLGVLAHNDEDVTAIEQPVGGPGASTNAPVGAQTISGSSIVRLRQTNDALSAQRGSNWEQVGKGILVLATQQGDGQ